MIPIALGASVVGIEPHWEENLRDAAYIRLLVRLAGSPHKQPLFPNWTGAVTRANLIPRLPTSWTVARAHVFLTSVITRIALSFVLKLTGSFHALLYTLE